MFCLFKVPQARFSACVAALTSPALFLAVGVASARAGTITTFAGNGTYTYGGDGGPATAAALFEPHGLGLGPNGSMYITTWMDARVRHVLPNGTMTTFAGTGKNGYDPAGGPATSCRLALPTSVVVDPRSGDVYISDDYRIVKVVANGTTVAVAGRYAQQGADDDGMPATAAALYSPYGLAINPAGHVVFTEDQHHRVRIVVANGTLWTIAGMGAQGYRGDGGPATAAQLYLPLDVAYDSAGTLYIADFGNNRVRKVNATTGVITTFAGNGSSAFGPDGVPATSTSVMRPSGVFVSRDGGLLIVEEDHERVRKVLANGTITTIAGTGHPGYSGDSGPATAAALNSPTRIVEDEHGNVFIVDGYNNRVRKVTI